MLVALNCANCGAPLITERGACSYCKTSFLMDLLPQVLRGDDRVLGERAQVYTKVGKDEPDHFASQVALIGIYVKRGLAGHAAGVARRLIAEYPDVGRSYLWLAVALIAKEGFRKLRLATAKEVTQLLCTGHKIDSREQDFIIVGRMLLEIYYHRNGISPSPLLVEISSMSFSNKEKSDLYSLLLR